MTKSPVKPKTAAERQARLQKILDGLDKLYPNVTCALDHSNAWELLAATILSAQCTDKRVNMVTPGLFRKYPTIQDFASASQEEMAEAVRSTGFYNNKAKSLIGAARKILSDFGGQVPNEIEKLLTVPGAARKTANVVLGTVYGIASGVVVDTHVQRISRRLDLTKETDPVKIERDLTNAASPTSATPRIRPPKQVTQTAASRTPAGATTSLIHKPSSLTEGATLYRMRVAKTRTNGEATPAYRNFVERSQKLLKAKELARKTNPNEAKTNPILTAWRLGVKFLIESNLNR